MVAASLELQLLAIDSRAGRAAVQLPQQTATKVLTAGASAEDGIRLLAINHDVAVIEWLAPDSKQPTLLRMRVGEAFRARAPPGEATLRVVQPMEKQATSVTTKPLRAPKPSARAAVVAAEQQ